VSALRVSPAITGVLEADPLPSARLSARVTPAGCRDEVAYRVALAAGERELLYSTQGTGHVFVGQPRGRSGRLAMTMLAGVRGRGQLVVYYLRDRNPVSVSTVASFRDAGSNGTERVSAIRLRGRKLTWTPTCGATRYEVTVSRPGQATSSSADVPHLTLASDRLPVTLTIAAQDAEGVTIATGRRTIRH